MTKRKNIRMEDNSSDEKVKEYLEESNPIKEVEKKQEVKDDSGFLEVDGLPTKGKFYPKGTIIKARPMKVLEVKMLSSITDENANGIVNEVLYRTVRGIDIDDLYSSDKLYLVFWLRASTYKDSGYEVKFKCPECKKNSEYDFELDVLNVKTVSDKEWKDINQEYELPDKNKIKFKLLKVKDENEIERFIKDNEGSSMNFDKEIVGMCKIIDTINGKKMGTIEKYRFIIEELNPSSYSKLLVLTSEVEVGLKPEITVHCKNCGGAVNVPLPFRPDFFLSEI